MPGFKAEKRFTYTDMKKIALGALYDFSRDLGVKKGRPHIQVVGMVSDCYENGFERPVEDVMWNCVLYILCGGWYAEPAEIIKKNIEIYIEKIGVENLLLDVPQDEANDFRMDLKIAGLI